MINDVNYFMNEAIIEATKALEIGELPVGAILVKDNKIVSRAHNTREIDNLITSHAEINAINSYSSKVGSWKLDGCDLYVTLEPCLMCAGAIAQSRIKNLYFGAYDKSQGAYSLNINLLNSNLNNHLVNVYPGILEKECSSLINKFFKEKRNKLR